jgi:uncharacterized protein DUF664
MVQSIDRRRFLGGAACLTAGVGFAISAGESTALAAASDADSIGLVGPKQGYAPHIGTLSSMMAFMRGQVTRSVAGMKLADLDFLFDAKANTIGALLMHLAATETYYQLHTFQGMPWGKFPEEANKKWEAASELGDRGRASIKGNELQHYLDMLQETRAKTLAEFKKRDDKWLFAIDKTWGWGPTNNYCKWFHVCEHEANHNGQIKFLKSRLPGAKAESGG